VASLLLVNRRSLYKYIQTILTIYSITGRVTSCPQRVQNRALSEALKLPYKLAYKSPL
jgi:hypothetical protein